MFANPTIYYGLALGILFGYFAGVWTMAIIQIIREDSIDMFKNGGGGALNGSSQEMPHM